MFMGVIYYQRLRHMVSRTLILPLAGFQEFKLLLIS